MFAYSVPAVVKALSIAQNYVMERWGGQVKNWTAFNRHQEFLLQNLDSHKVTKLVAVLGSDITAKASVTASEIIVLTILNIVVEWLETGIPYNKGQYEGILLKSGFDVFDNAVVRLETKTGDLVYIRAGVVEAPNVWSFVEAVNDLSEDTKRAGFENYEEVVFPRTNVVDQEIDMSKVLGLRCCEIARVVKAKQKVNFSMDEVGAKVKVEVEVVMMRGMSRPPKRFVIDGPFVVWVVKRNSNIPYFCVNITKDFLTVA